MKTNNTAWIDYREELRTLFQNIIGENRSTIDGLISGGFAFYDWSVALENEYRALNKKEKALISDKAVYEYALTKFNK